MAKRFIDLTDKDSIYQLSPITFKVEALKIKTISGIDPAKVLLRPVLKRWVRIEVFTSTLILHSPEIEKIPTTTFFFDGDQHLQLANVMVKDALGQRRLPVPFSADKQTLETWMKK